MIVGAGLGGLATALRLAHQGHRVTVFEKTDQVGGRNREVRVGDAIFDGGPTLMMMLDPFRKLFADVGERMEDHLEISLCDPSYRVFYADGKRIEGTPNVARMVQQIEKLSGREDSLAYPKLLGDLAALYKASIPNFVQRNFFGPGDFLTPKAVNLVAKHRMLGNYARQLERYVQDPRLRMLFSFQTMYLGLSPYEAPWVYATLTYMEYGEGIWYPKGGMVEICRAVARLAEERGATIRLNTPVRSAGEHFVELESGERIQADAVILNADLPYAERELLDDKPARADRRKYSCSAYMTYIDYAGELPDLLHHNVFFGADFEGNLEDIFNRGKLPVDPAFYACLSGRSDPDKRRYGYENLYILVPCPNLERPWSDADACTLQKRVFDRLAKEVGFDETRIVGMRDYTPQDWSSELNLDRGAAFGLSHHFNQSAFFRPTNRSRSHKGVYYVGASTIPGNGLPMVLISAELAVDRMRHDGVL